MSLAPIDIEGAARFLADRFGNPGPPAAHLVLGSGLGALADAVESPTMVPFDAIPGFPATGVPGHAGRWVQGRLEGRPVLVQQGRFHVYEGHAMEVVTAPVRMAAELGAPITILTNAAGGIRDSLVPGSLMLIADHINLMARNPLTGPVRGGESRFTDMTVAWDLDLRGLARRIAAEEGVELQEGVYTAVPGPSFETPAEIRMIGRLGGDVVGMSTVPEVLVARARGLRCLGFSLVTNLAAGRSGRPLDHAEVLAMGESAGGRLERILRGVVRELPE